MVSMSNRRLHKHVIARGIASIGSRETHYDDVSRETRSDSAEREHIAVPEIGRRVKKGRGVRSAAAGAPSAAQSHTTGTSAARRGGEHRRRRFHTPYEPVAISPVTMPDGSQTPLRLFPACGRESLFLGSEIYGQRATQNASAENHVAYKNRVVVLWPGFGVGARYYDPMARELANRGFDVAIAELRGQGDSTAVATKDNQFGYHTAIVEDYPRVIAAAREMFHVKQSTPVTLLCHSMGGQIATFFLMRDEAKQLHTRSGFFVGTGSPYYKNFEGREYRRLRLGMPLMREISRVVGFWPGGRLDVAGYGRQSAEHIQEWATLVGKDVVKFVNPDVDYGELAESADATICFARCLGDRDCSMDSINGMLAHVGSMNTKVLEIPENYGHNQWARHPEAVADEFEKFVAELPDGA